MKKINTNKYEEHLSKTNIVRAGIHISAIFYTIRQARHDAASVVDIRANACFESDIAQYPALY